MCCFNWHLPLGQDPNHIFKSHYCSRIRNISYLVTSPTPLRYLPLDLPCAQKSLSYDLYFLSFGVRLSLGKGRWHWAVTAFRPLMIIFEFLCLVLCRFYDFFPLIRLLPVETIPLWSHDLNSSHKASLALCSWQRGESHIPCTDSESPFLNSCNSSSWPCTWGWCIPTVPTQESPTWASLKGSQVFEIGQAPGCFWGHTWNWMAGKWSLCGTLSSPENDRRKWLTETMDCLVHILMPSLPSILSFDGLLNSSMP